MANEITFPAEEHDHLKRAFSQGRCICTTRVQKEKGVYQVGDELKTPWGTTVVVSRVAEGQGLDNHPNYEHLNDRMKAEIADHPFDLVYLEEIDVESA